MQEKRQRLIVPDLARGTALLGIAMANAVQSWIVNEWSVGPSSSVGGVRPDSTFDVVAAVFTGMFVRVRGLPMFCMLAGFGIGLITASLHRKGYTVKESRCVLIRRYGLLAVFGLAHGFLLFNQDIMLVYGLMALAMAWCLTLSTRTLRRIAYWFFGGYAVFAGSGAVAAYFGYLNLLPSSRPMTRELVTFGDFFARNVRGEVAALGQIPLMFFGLTGVFLIGYIWAREGVLASVSAHRRTLVTWVVIAGVIIVFIGLPWGLAAAGVVPTELEPVFFMLNQAFGFLTGPGILAVLALLTEKLNNRVPGWAYAFVALGKRSMSGYIAQSILFIVLVTPAGLGLGADASVSGKLGIGLLVFVLTLLLAALLEAWGKPGPFEWAHRRLAYGPTGRIEPKSAPAPA
ncbi:DUF418 domain-containing protein [uncultured Corynebacterium sp.]|uniref:DUF418 domain-containing protein n=1 Tax=uncultured Corynebacterium sp. TaxID=159447 RepID=UPI0025DD0030|nr:DUF418 domain-containing protein [uncultured Corynebacterium sp.]